MLKDDLLSLKSLNYRSGAVLPVPFIDNFWIVACQRRNECLKLFCYIIAAYNNA